MNSLGSDMALFEQLLDFLSLSLICVFIDTALVFLVFLFSVVYFCVHVCFIKRKTRTNMELGG